MSDPTDQAPGPADDGTALLNFVASRDMPCPACGYNLRMLSKPVCPECGLSLKLTVGSGEPFRRAWAIVLCLNAMVGGAGLFFLLITLNAGGPTFDEFVEYLWYFIAILWIPVPLLILLIRKRFCRWDSYAQNAILGMSVLLILVLGGSLVSSFN
jgi:hypothetical protein